MPAVSPSTTSSPTYTSLTGSPMLYPRLAGHRISLRLEDDTHKCVVEDLRCTALDL